jgi:predicted TIM-barrel fold metal-dependent hydrolase
VTTRRDFARIVTGGLTGLGFGQVPKEDRAIDTHAHVFTKTLRMAPGSRYTPDYDATPQQFLSLLDRHGIRYGVLVQPSFLGTDNSYLLAALEANPKRLRGVVVIDPGKDVEKLEAMNRSGAVGLRLNLFGLPDPDLPGAQWKKALSRARDLDWFIEIHAEAHRLSRILPPLLAAGSKIVIDHFGRPDPDAGVADPGFRYLCGLAKTGLVRVKISGAYRNGADGKGESIAMAAIPLLRNAFGLERLLWGSDWPHTQNESSMTFDRAWEFLEKMLPAAARATVLCDSPARLYRFR